MYNEYFGLEEAPFSIAPDPRYLYMSDQHREALAHLLYGIRSAGGFVLLTGEVGTGKTTVCRYLLEQLPDQTDVAFIFNPRLSAQELLATVCDEFGIVYPRGETGSKILVDRLNAFLLEEHARGRRAVLIIDEAQNLSVDVLEQLRLLTNLETNRHKLLQIILLGQPELQALLATSQLRQLSQRIIARYHLKPLTPVDVAAYVSHRLSVAGLEHDLFSRRAIRMLYRLSRGVPRIINILCDRAFLGAYATGQRQITPQILRRAAREVSGVGSPQRKRLAWSLLILLFFLVGGGALAAGRVESWWAAKRAQVGDSSVPLISSSDWLPVGSADKQQAYRDLFFIWGRDVSMAGDAPCLSAKALGLECFNKKGSLRDLRHLNRPAVLTLVDRSGTPCFVTLESLEGNRAQLLVGGKRMAVPTPDLESRWTGDYSLLWRSPPESDGGVRFGDKGAGVSHVEQRLASVQGWNPRPGTELLFDETLAIKVRQFQLTRGLVPDGIVGAQTLIHLNTAAGDDVPLLFPPKEGF
ncbi:type II secretory pathway, ExeA component [Desulfuromonas soudanensis]|uniref:Type II secretory pathway, ExeA component n=1 Tax=Desulfuromonas soudanensis TaxID=1603606 RepID=A0A0M3QFU6_9BACT|nr:ExeA family protein [Desulfuromonas soudanensis]ALC16683.1 type II secretory pathway, ExeA component [Desulfuromonas soudanensis]